jgi:hypothetical protein
MLKKSIIPEIMFQGEEGLQEVLPLTCICKKRAKQT